ncbi:MAG: hypothetical protein KDH90_19445 [Anaerolineae bacterium]|nr:hypothetical protein [Anaerolineae bacterium]
MSDYLSGLAARSLPSTDVVLPRLASRFEPKPGAGLFLRAPGSRSDGLALGWEDLAELTAEPGPPASRRMASPPAARALPSLNVTSSGQPSDETSADAVSARRSPGSQAASIVALVPQAVSRLSHAAQPVEPAPQPGSAAPSQAASGAAAPASRLAEPASLASPQVGASVRPSDQPLALAEVFGLEQRIRSAVGNALAGELAQHAGQDRPTPQQVVPSAVQPAAPARVIAQPQVTIAAARPAMADAAAAGRLTAQPEPPPAPTIHVTIGRIEVRATPASTAASPSRPKPAPTMSLDDYLRQRNGGSR